MPLPDVQTPAQVEYRHDDGAIVAVLRGDWSLDDALPRFEPPAGIVSGSAAVSALEFETGALGSWDSSLLTFLLQAGAYCEAHEVEFVERGLPEGITRLLELSRVVLERQVAPEPGAASFVARFGTAGLGLYDALLEAVAFLGQVGRALARLALRRTRPRWRDFWVVVQSNSSGALPIVTLIAFLTGMIISFLGAVVLRRFGAGYFVSYLVGYGMLREMAALMTGIIIAGRTGAAFAAEIGSMKVAEEIDALRTLGISPVDHLVMPRVLGLLVTMPLLSIYAAGVGIAGGMIVAITVLELSVTQFVSGLLTAVTLSDAVLGVVKGTTFGLIVGLAGCMKGLQTGAGARAVGRAATSAVVLGITLIIGANALIDWVAVLLDV